MGDIGKLREGRNREWVRVALPSRSREEFSDIIDSQDRPEGFVDSFVYRTESPYDVPEEEIQTREDLESGIETEALIDFRGKHAVVFLDADLYADSPGDELTEVAQDVLLAWAEAYREGLVDIEGLEEEGPEEEAA